MSTKNSDKKNKKNYNLIFDEDFNDSDLNLKHWVPYYLPQWSSREKSKPNFTIKDNLLTLQINKNHQPWCPEFNGDVKCSSLQTGMYAGCLE